MDITIPQGLLEMFERSAEFEVICDRSTVPLEDNLKALERDC